jgi:hemerythrin-like domain-containing protein
VDRIHAYGRQLIEIHDGLREALDALRRGEDADLGLHCLAFCAAVTEHHTDEDSSVFPVLARQFPELSDVLAGLERDHQAIAGLLRRLRELAAEPDRAAIQRELDGLAALIEGHFTWEERRLVAALDASRRQLDAS